MKKALTFPIIFLCFSAQAQLNPQVGVLFGLTYGKAEAQTPDVAEMPLKAGTKTGIRINLRISQTIQFETGFEYVFKAFGFHFTYTDNGLETRRSSSTLDDFEIPILIAPRVYSSSKWVIKPLIGLSYCIFHEYQPTRIGGPNPVSNYFHRIEYATVSGNYVSARLSGQILRTLSNGNNLGLNLDLNFHNAPIIEGTVSRRDQTGYYTTRFEYTGTYLSISLIYLFKLKKKADPSHNTG